MNEIPNSKLLAEIYRRNPEKFEITLVRNEYIIEITTKLSREELSEMLNEKYRV